ncbi:MAG: hypothetical protein AAF502_14905 [Bacteroidota bacterium]
MRCPTCKKDGLLITTKICPRCETQITSDYELEDSAEKIHLKEYSLLRGKIVELAQKKERAEQKNSRTRAYLILMGLMLFAVLMFRKTPAPIIETVESGPKIQQLEEQQAKLEATIEDLQDQLGNRTPEKIIYEIQKGDNLTKISNLFYNDPDLLTAIAMENNIPIPDRIIEGDTLEILLVR